MSKSPDAFRTISEVAEWLDTQAHVLRFWESKFPQVKPVKRAGGRRYYRPQDMMLLGGLKTLLHDQGNTIKGVQKLLREKGVKYVSDLSPPIDGDDLIEATASAGNDSAEEVPQNHPAQITPVDADDYLPEEASTPAAPEDALPEDSAAVSAEDDLPEDLPPEEPAAALSEDEDDDDLDDDLSVTAPSQTAGGIDGLSTPAQPPLADTPSDTPADQAEEEAEEETDLPAPETIPAFMNRVTPAPAPDDTPAEATPETDTTAELAEDSADDTPEPAPVPPAVPSPPPADPPRVAGGHLDNLLQDLSRTTGIAPEHRPEAARLVAKLAAIRARSKDVGAA